MFPQEPGCTERCEAVFPVFKFSEKNSQPNQLNFRMISPQILSTRRPIARIHPPVGGFVRLQGLRPNFSTQFDVGAEEFVWQLGFGCGHACAHSAMWLKVKMPP